MVRGTGARVKKLAIAMLLVLAACRGKTGNVSPTAGGANSPREAIDRFLASAKSQDYDAMGLIFGTAAGPARATINKDELEKREFIMMRCLRHEGLPAETAAIALYRRTGRPLPDDLAGLSTDSADWAQYLARQLQVTTR